MEIYPEMKMNPSHAKSVGFINTVSISTTCQVPRVQVEQWLRNVVDIRHFQNIKFEQKKCFFYLRRT